MELKEIIQRCTKGDRKAQNLLFSQYAPLFLSVCRRYMGTHHLAEDMMVQGFCKVFAKIDQYNHQGSFEGWMRRIMVNECLMELRKKKTISDSLTIEDVNQSEFAVDFEDKLEYQEVIDLLDELPEGYRTVFNLFALEGYKHREIADMLDISINTSKSQLILARRKLQALIKKKLNFNLAL